MSGSALMAQLAVIVNAMADDEMTSEAVALVLGFSKRTVQRIPRDRLPYRETPGGGLRRGHRKYLRADVERYAKDLGREIQT